MPFVIWYYFADAQMTNWLKIKHSASDKALSVVLTTIATNIFLKEEEEEQNLCELFESFYF